MLRPYKTLLKASLSRRIVLWIFASIVVIEGIILIPSVYRREQELLRNLREISAAKASGILETKPPGLSDDAILNYLGTAQTNEVVLGGRLYANGQEIGTFGEPPELTWDDLRQRRRKDFYHRQTVRYDALWEMSSLANTYALIIRHDASGVKAEFFNFIKRIVGLVVIISIFVTGATMVVLNRIVIMPICRLRGDLVWAGEVISREELDPPPTFASLETQRHDELGEVMMAFGQMVDQITEAIAERREAEQALARLAEIGELSSMIVHEVRNPLTTVLMGLNSFKTMDLGDRAKARLSLALEESERLQRLLNEILMYAKQQKLDLAPLDLGALVQELVEPLRSMPSALNRHIVVDAPAQPLFIQGDRDKLKQVFINLVSNACEAIAEGEIVSWTINHHLDSNSGVSNSGASNSGASNSGVSNSGVSNSGASNSGVSNSGVSNPIPSPKQTQIQVHNGGKIIPADVLPRLTQPFFTTKSTGNGLGLAITKRIVEAHGGSLVITSTPETGTTVLVSLPSISLPTGSSPTTSSPTTSLPTTSSPTTSSPTTSSPQVN